MDGAVLLALSAAAAVAGAAFGYWSDRLGARWPEHEDGSVRPRDWRTILVVAAGAIAFGATVARFSTNPAQLAAVGIYVAALVVLFATDLDQRLLPDVITLPLVGYAVLVYALGANPFILSIEELAWAAAAAVVIPAGLFLLAIPFGQGAIGQGDLKLLLSAGILAGATKLFYGLIVGAALAGLIVGVLVLVRRISLQSYVPYGPFLIAGLMWAILGLPPR